VQHGVGYFALGNGRAAALGVSSLANNLRGRLFASHRQSANGSVIRLQGERHDDLGAIGDLHQRYAFTLPKNSGAR
jgi:hypothetical protein